MELKLDFLKKQIQQAAIREDAPDRKEAGAQAHETAADSEITPVKRVVILKCKAARLQNYEEEYGEPGRQLMLIREPDNEYDRWATKVCTLSGTMLGYLPMYRNQSVARLMDAGKTVTVFVDDPSDVSGQTGHAPSLPLTVYLEIPQKER